MTSKPFLKLGNGRGQVQYCGGGGRGRNVPNGNRGAPNWRPSLGQQPAPWQGRGERERVGVKKAGTTERDKRATT
jgi:hypothetical protein